MNMCLVLAALALMPQPLKVVEKEGTTGKTNVTVVTDISIPREGYRLTVSADGVKIESSDSAGAFYASQTLEQLRVRNADGKEVFLLAEVEDAPRFRWRGMHFDDCRHFFGKDVLKKTLDIMAQYKLNVLHWHLTDDQGWRIDVPGMPELVKYGSVRAQSPCHGAKLRELGKLKWASAALDGTRYGPFFYTRADLEEIVAYAKARHITIVPEIELPGHSRGVLAAFPELACFPENITQRMAYQDWGITTDVLCIGNDKTLRFLENVFNYVCDVFPSEVIHIGGDECPSIMWGRCPKCRKRIADEGLGDEKGLQPWITRHLVKFLAERGRRAIGWDEYLLGEGIPNSAIGMSWRVGKEATDHEWLSPADLAAKGYDVVMTPNTFCYLDYGQGLEDDPFQYIGGCMTLKKCYSLDLCAGVPTELRKHILGGQGNNWSEYTWNQYDLEWKMWPRGCALAEVFWCGDRKPPFEDFLRRIKIIRKRLIGQGLNCAPIQ